MFTKLNFRTVSLNDMNARSNQHILGIGDVENPYISSQIRFHICSDNVAI